MNNKQLKFDSHLVPLVLSGDKTSTWRLWDDKNLRVGDVVDFVDRGTDQKYATAELVKVIEKPIKDLTEEDQAGMRSTNPLMKSALHSVGITNAR